MIQEITIDGVTYICTPKEEAKHEYIDLGLPSGRLWATCNIGAKKPADYGNYFACGSVEPYNINDCNTNSFNCTNAANLTEMDDEHDAAKVLWGDNWRMPTLTDFAELIEHCTYSSEIIDGISCGVFTSKVNNQKIVMPAAGYVNGGSLHYCGSYCSYWSRSFYLSSGAWRLGFNSSGRDVSAYDRDLGFSVRPVRC